MNMLALVDGQPQTLSLKQVLQHHIDWRREVVRRRTEFDLGKARDRAHILEGLKIALDNLDAVIKTIRESADVDTARGQPDRALQAVRDPGQRDPRDAAPPAGRARAQEDRGRVPGHDQAHRRARGHPGQPGARARRSSRTSCARSSTKYAGERLTRVQDDADRELTDEDLIADEDVVVTVSGRGYIKRQPLATYRRQARGGKGIIGARTVEEDAVAHLLVANTHDWALFFTNQGRVFSSKVHQVPDASRQAKGIPIINLEGVQVESGRARPGDRDHRPNFETGDNMVMATRKGVIKKTPIEQFERVRSTGIRAITVAEGDELAWVARLVGRRRRHPRDGRRARSRASTRREVRPMGRDAAGVIGIRLARPGRPGRRHGRRPARATTSWC